jgi:anti-sigma factor (TIGR02949 family)
VKPPLDCKETFRRLDDYLDRELSADETAAVARHLEDCAVCAEEFAVEHELIDALKEKLRHLKAPEGLMARIVRRLEAES